MSILSHIGQMYKFCIPITLFWVKNWDQIDHFGEYQHKTFQICEQIYFPVLV